MNNAPERNEKPSTRKALPSVFGRITAQVTLLPLVLYVLILVLNVEVGLAQGPSSDLKRRESNTLRLDRARRLVYHSRFLRQVAKSSPRIEVVWSMEKVFPSLRFITENGSDKDNEAAKAVGSIFGRTEDTLARDLCLAALRKIGNKAAKREMLRIFNDTTIPAEWRTRCAEYLGMPLQSSQAGATSGSHTKTSP